MKSAYCGSVKNKVDTAPATGATASAKRNAFAFFAVFLCVSISVTVFIPSVKSWAITARATTMPTEASTWNQSPIPTPSKNECPMSAAAENMPTFGWWWLA